MPKFKVGERVAVMADPEPRRCGTVKEIVDVDPEATLYLISWDDQAVGKRFETELIPCPGSHTDK
jgi:hypothetical protein